MKWRWEFRSLLDGLGSFALLKTLFACLAFQRSRRALRGPSQQDTMLHYKIIHRFPMSPNPITCPHRLNLSTSPTYNHFVSHSHSTPALTRHSPSLNPRLTFYTSQRTIPWSTLCPAPTLSHILIRRRTNRAPTHRHPVHSRKHTAYSTLVLHNVAENLSL